jgi:hypothetical protein
VTVHLISGDAAAGGYRRGDGTGNVIVWREALIAGPLRAEGEPAWLETRARFLATAERDRSMTRQDLAAQEMAIAAALDGDELVLWFARDLFCELGLLRVLATIAAAPARRAQLALVSPADSGTAAFRCFGELPPEEMVPLVAGRRTLGDADLAAAAAAWAAITSDDPTAIDRLLAAPPQGLLGDIAADALAKQRARFPSFVSGLGRTEQAALALVAGGADSLAAVLAGIGDHLPGYGWTDIQLATELAGLAVGTAPLIALTGGSPLDPTSLLGARLAITDSGREVLRATTDRVDACGIDTWLGGVHLTRDYLWRFDESASRLLPS